MIKSAKISNCNVEMSPFSHGFMFSGIAIHCKPFKAMTMTLDVFQIYEVMSFGEVLGLMIAIITLSHSLSNPSSPKYSTGVNLNSLASPIFPLSVS